MPQKAPTSPLKHLWKSLESLPTLQAVKEEWKTLLKEEFSSVEPLLTPCRDLATSYPRRGRSRIGMPLRVVQHGEEDFVAVCDETGDRHAISREDLIVYRFDAPRFTSMVATTLRLTPVRRDTAVVDAAMMVGVCNATVGLGSTVFLSLDCSSRGLESSILTLMSSQNRRFFLFTPTEQFWSSRVISLMQSRQSDLFSLQASFWASASGEWTAVEHVIQHLNPALGENCDTVEPKMGVSVIEQRHYDAIQELNEKCVSAGIEYEDKKADAAAAKRRHESLQSQLNQLIAQGASPQRELEFPEQGGEA